MIPFEIITFFGAGIMGALKTVWGLKIKGQQVKEELMMARDLQVYKAVKAAREYKNPGYQWTRRIIALSIIGAVIVLPLATAALGGNVQVTTGYTEFSPGFLWREGKEVIRWVVTTGLTITPLHTHAVMAVMGMYFGSSSVRNA